MKSFGFLGSIALVTLSAGSATLAADLPVKAPVYRAAVAAPYYDWNGLYFGGHLGWGWSRAETTTVNIATGLALGTVAINSDGFLGGAQIGFNFMATPTWLLGIEADIAFGDVNGALTDVTTTTVNDRSKIDRFGTARGRIGYVAGNWLIYGTGGFAWAHENVTRTQVAGTVNAATPGTAESASGTRGGWTAGGGIEWGFSPNWSVKAEYLYVDLTHTSFVFPLANRRWEEDLSMHTVRVGLNWRFNWARAPITGKY
jgi:opacity protein-like surface antigen